MIYAVSKQDWLTKSPIAASWIFSGFEKTMARRARCRVSSDIRQNIETLFSENGIVIAFPQRDVRLDSARPLKIEPVPVGPAAGFHSSSH